MGQIKVFVYGTLMKGKHNRVVLGNSEYLGEATLHKHELYSLPYGFPAVRHSKAGNVKGELYLVNEERLPALDMLEGYNADTKQGMYIRTCNWVDVEQTGQREWVYYYLWNRSIPEGSILEPDNTKWDYRRIN